MKPSDYGAVEKRRGSAGVGNTWLESSSLNADAIKQPLLTCKMRV